MRSFTAIILGVGLCSSGVLLSAADSNELYLAHCKNQVSQRYGVGLEFKLVSMRRSRSGMTFKVAVRLDSGASDKELVEFMTCRLGREELPGGVVKEGPDMPGSGAIPAGPQSR